MFGCAGGSAGAAVRSSAGALSPDDHDVDSYQDMPGATELGSGSLTGAPWGHNGSGNGFAAVAASTTGAGGATNSTSCRG